MENTNYLGICVEVISGNLIRTLDGEILQLYDVCTPQQDENGYSEALKLLQDLLLKKEFTWYEVGRSGTYTLANVALLIDDISANAYMRRKGYTC